MLKHSPPLFGVMLSAFFSHSLFYAHPKHGDHVPHSYDNCFFYSYAVRCLSSQLLEHRQQMKFQKAQSRYSDLKRHLGSHANGAQLAVRADIEHKGNLKHLHTFSRCNNNNKIVKVSPSKMDK